MKYYELIGKFEKKNNNDNNIKTSEHKLNNLGH